MYEDDPQDKVFDVLGEAVFGDHPLGPARSSAAPRSSPARRPTGLRDVPRRRATCRATSSSPRPARSTTTRSSSWSRGARPSAAARRRARPPAARRARAPRALRRARTPSSTTSASAARASPRDDERRFALRVLDNILGGTSSSRLFQEVREKRGLAYAVYSFQSLYARTGQVGLYLGTRPDNVGRALRVVGDELERFRETPATPGRARALARRTSRAASCWRWSRRPRG